MFPTAQSIADNWTLYCDGTSAPNPGRMGIGAVMTAPDGARHTLSRATGTSGCNNEAEARALIAALQELHARGATALRIHSDSSILIAQLGSSAAAPIMRLAHIFAEARELLSLFGHVELLWVPRHRNAEADSLARAALGLPTKDSVPMGGKKKKQKRRR